MYVRSVDSSDLVYDQSGKYDNRYHTRVYWAADAQGRARRLDKEVPDLKVDVSVFKIQITLGGVLCV